MRHHPPHLSFGLDLVTGLRILLERGMLKIPTRIHSFDSIRENLQDKSGSHHNDIALAARWATRSANR